MFSVGRVIMKSNWDQLNEKGQLKLQQIYAEQLAEIIKVKTA